MKLRFTRTNGAADAAIDSLLDLVGGIGQREIVREMVLARPRWDRKTTEWGS